MAYIVMSYIGMAYIFVTYIGMAYIVYIVMAPANGEKLKVKVKMTRIGPSHEKGIIIRTGALGDYVPKRTYRERPASLSEHFTINDKS